MIIWIVTVGEPIPQDGLNVRLHRSGIMSRMLADQGHQVHWFNSRFNHFSKQKRVVGGDINIDEKYTIHQLEGVSYKKNVSFERMLNHLQIAKDFEKTISTMDKPDVILCSFPTIELSECCVKFGVKNDIPVFIDVRDLWPDIFTEILPVRLRWLGKIILHKMYKKTKYVMENAHAITAVSEDYLKWGLNYANREKRDRDAIFPLAYPMLESNWQADRNAEERCIQLGIQPTRTIILFIGTFGRTYDLAPVILGTKSLNAKLDSPTQLVLCGDGEHDDKWKAMSENDPNIIFTGWVEKPDLEYLMSISNIGVAAYKEGAPQGVPNKVIEYLARGLPLLSSLTGETELLLSEERCGYSYDATSSDDFERKLIAILENGTCETMSSNCNALYMKKFAAESIYQVYISKLHSSTI